MRTLGQISGHTKILFKGIILLGILLISTIGNAQEFKSFEIRYQNNLKGELTFLANNILNRSSGSTPPEVPYDLTGNASQYNDYLNMQYIDVDEDPNTFSSSSATLTYPDASCNLVRYAGLYWSATYPSENSFQSVGTNRQSDFNQVKFKLPGGSYVDITADEILHDGFTSSDISVRQNSPYACYADVTDLISGLADPQGEYTVANVRATTGQIGGGASAGWTLVIVYENPTLTGKRITTFDGFARVRNENPIVDIDYSGFNTIPVGPVRANIGVAALEGDNRITGDQLRIRAAGNAGFTTLSDPVNATNNFFNSNITQGGSLVTTRNPNSVNTLGYDTDMFFLNNPLNSVLPNSETAATFRFTSNGDQYYPFFNSFNVEVIEPDILLQKRVEDLAGNDITGGGVNLGQVIDYVLSFQNQGNDNATNYVIKDILPVNVVLSEADLSLPPGVTYTYNPLSRELILNIPDNLVEVGDPFYEIRLRVRISENCFDFVDACSDTIQNLAYSTYQGVINSNQITDDPSVSDFDACGFSTPGSTNFLLDDLSDCGFFRSVELCGNDIILDAGDNFDSYVWYRDNNANGAIDEGDTVITDSDPDNDPSTMRVTQAGQYIVDKLVADPCKGFQEVIQVTLPGVTQFNPIVTLLNDSTSGVVGEVSICPNDGQPLPKIFLCGINDSELIQINLPDASSIVWEKLDEGSCMAVGEDCANKNSACSWSQVDTGNDFLAAESGEYRVVVNYQNGCFTRFYFNVFKNLLDPQYNVSDIICTTEGNITVTNVPSGYEFQLLDAVSGNILVPFEALNGPSFSIAQSGVYTVEIRQQGVVGGCLFYLEDIGVRNRNFEVEATASDVDCNGLGAINIAVSDVEPQYYFELLQNGVLIDTNGPGTDNQYTFENLSAGTYTVAVTTDDGCTFNEEITILDVSNLAAEALTVKPIDCTEGIITVSGSGGFPNPDYLYAVWSVNGTDLYSTVNEIPADSFQSNGTFSFVEGQEGSYQFIVVDANNCYSLTNVATVNLATEPNYDLNIQNETCFGAADGSVSLIMSDNNGYLISYALNSPGGSIIENTSGNFNGLAQGNYVLTITRTLGGNSCDTTINFAIEGPAAGLSAEAQLTQTFTCLQEATVQAVQVQGGTAPYQYALDGINFQLSDTFSGLTEGEYAITVRDANGCVILTNAITVAPLAYPDDLTFTETALTCPDLTTNLTVRVNSGTAPFLFEIIAPNAIAVSEALGVDGVFNDLAPGTYTFRVTDSNGCTYVETYTINPITPIGVSGQLVSQIGCFGGTDGSVLFDVSGFQSTYDYAITGPVNFAATGSVLSRISVENLTAGTYTITVTDAVTGCQAIAQSILESPALPLSLTASGIQPTCSEDGSISLLVSGGWGGNNFTLIFPDGVTAVNSTTGTFTGLTQTGTYTAQMQDANGCVATATFNLVAPIEPEIELYASSDCYNSNDGLTIAAFLTAGMGDGNFLYRINGGDYGPSNVFPDLGPGTYTVEVIDSNNCSDSATITINPELSVSAIANSMAACDTETQVSFSAVGGAGNYVYAFLMAGNSPTDADFTSATSALANLAGSYVVYVRDNFGNSGYCQSSFNVDVLQDNPVSISYNATDVLCFGNNTGAVEVIANGGRAPYAYSLDNGVTFQNTGVFLNLPAGLYPVLVRDSEGCEAIDSVNITEADPLVAEALITQNLTCLSGAEITVGAITPTSGGSGNYQYSLNGGAWSTSTTGGVVYSGILEGSYTIRVRDVAAPSCVLILPAVVIDPLPVAPELTYNIDYECDGNGVLTVFPADSGYTYSINGSPFQVSNVFNGLTPGNYAITVDYGLGCTTVASVQVLAGNDLQGQLLSVTDALCFGGSTGGIQFEVINLNPAHGFVYQVNGGGFSSPQFDTTVSISGLPAGNYSVQIQDVQDSSCEITLNVTVSEPTALLATLAQTDDLTCSNGGAALTASATGGTPGYLYQLEDAVGTVISAYQPGSTFNTIPAGQYRVRVRDVNGCESAVSDLVTVAEPEQISFTAEPTLCYSGNSDGQIQISVNQGNGGYAFSLNGGPWIFPSLVSATEFIFENLTAGTYQINVRDEYGCVGTPLAVTLNPAIRATAALTASLACESDAVISIAASGGTGNYLYEWSADGGSTWSNTGIAGNSFSTNSAGTYLFRITDSTTSCLVITQAINVVEPTAPVISSVVATDIYCYSDLSGSLSIAIDQTTGLAPYTISIVETGSGTVYGNQTTGLPAGNYSISVTDANGCVSAPYTIAINQPDAIVHDVNIEPISCDATGITPGSVTVQNVTGGSGSYTYYLIGNNGFSAQFSAPTGADYTFGPLQFGIYELDVVDSNGCSLKTTNIIASPPDDLDIDVSTLTADCASGGTAIVTVSSLVGSGDYEFAILESYTAPYATTYQDADAAGGYTATFTALIPGITYTFVVHDKSNDCYYFESAAAPVNSPSGMTATSLATANVTCTGAADGTVSLEIAGYDPTATGVYWEVFNFQSNAPVSPAQSGTLLTDPSGGSLVLNNAGPLAPGVYYVLLSEVGGGFNGCSVATSEFTITQSTNPLEVSATVTSNDNCNFNAGTITATAQYGTGPYQFQFREATAAAPLVDDLGWSTVTFANVEAGDYVAYVKDANGCIQAAPVSVELDPQPEIVIALVDACAEEGSFEVRIDLINPGISPYQYSVNGGPYQNSTIGTLGYQMVSGLSSGLNQTISVRDLNGCSVQQTIDIYPPLEFTASLTGLLNCEPGTDGFAEIIIAVERGSGTYEFEVSGPVNQLRAALPANPYTWHGASLPGSYTVTLYDVSTPVPNCLGSAVVEVPEIVLPEFSTVETDVTCFGSNDGSIAVIPQDNGTSPLTFNISPAAGSFDSLTNTFINLSPGTYTVTATGVNACSTEISGIVIAEPAGIVVGQPIVTPFGCAVGNAVNSASIFVDFNAVTGGSGSYVSVEFVNNMGTADLSDDIVVQSGSATTFTLTNTAGGSFTINVYDSNGCVGTANAAIPAYDELLSIAAQITQTVSCNPGMDGEITVFASTRSGDMSLLEYSIDGGLNWQITPVFSGLNTGTYTLLVRNRETGCVLSQNQMLDLPEPFSIVASVIQDQSCYGTPSGAVTLELQDTSYNGGFDWIIYQTNGTPSDLSDDLFVLSGTNSNSGPTTEISLFAGTYRVSVTQVQIPGCSQDEFFVVDGPEAPIIAAVALSPISCALNDGIIEIYNVNGGSAPYQFYVGITPPASSSEFGDSPRFENVSSGVYQAWILDGFGCQTLVSDALTLTDPEPITANLQINQENCTEFQGQIEVVNVTGGMGSNYVFQLLRNSLVVGSPQSNPVFAGLGAGTYEVRITDPMGCETILGAQTLYSEINLLASVISGLRCDNPAAGAVDLLVQGGSSSLEFTVQYPDGITIQTNNSGSFTGLSQPGQYIFTVLDLETGSECSESIALSLAAPSTVSFEAPILTNVSCNGGSNGSIRVNLAESGPGINDNPIYSFVLYRQGNRIAGPQVSPLFEGLTAGVYELEAISAQGCSASQSVTLTEPNPLTLSTDLTSFVCQSENEPTAATLAAIVPAGSGSAPYLYSLDAVNYQQSNTFEIIDTGSIQNITVYVLDANGCAVSEDVMVYPLNQFTPEVSELSALSCVNSGQLQITVFDNGNPANAYNFELLPAGNSNGNLLSSPSNNQAVFEVLNPGNYVFRVTDTATGCWAVTETFEIAPFDILEVRATPLTSSVCFGDTQGSAGLAILNYEGNYNYEVFLSGGLSTGISGTANTNNPLVINGLGGGMYFVQITETDSPFCQSTSNRFTIASASAALSALVSQAAPVTCNDDQGEISVIPQGGIGPYKIVLENSTTGQAWETTSNGGTLFTELSSGIYNIRIEDAAGCVIEEQQVLEAPIVLAANAEASPAILECFGDTNGMVTAIQVSGGSGSYQYQLHSYDTSESVIISTSGFQTGPVFSGLGSGVYSITVSDGWGCDIETNVVRIDEPSEVSGSLIQLVQQSCNAEAQLLLEASGGTGPYQYSLDGIQFLPMSSGDSHIFPVGSGTYQYYVRDSFGCGAQISNQVEVEPLTPLNLALDTDAAIVNCFGEATATILATASGGLGDYEFTLYSDAALSNSLSGPQPSGSFDSLSAGSYWIKVNSADCEAVSQVVIISEPQPLIIEREEVLSATCSGENDGSITVEVSGGAGNIQYAISPNLNQFDVTNTFTGLAPGTYQVIAQDSSGCFLLFDFEISEPEPIQIMTTTTPEVCSGTADGMLQLEIIGGQAPYWTALNSNQPAAFVKDRMFFSDLVAGTHVIFVRDSRGCESNAIITIDPGVNLNATVTPVYSCTGELPDNYLEVVLENPSLSDEVMYALDSTDPADMQLLPDFRNIAPGSHYLAISHINGCLTTLSFEINDFQGLTLTLEEGNLNQLVATAQGGSPQYQFWLNDVDMGSENTYYISESGTYTVRVMDQNGCQTEAQLYLQYIDIELPDHFSPSGEVLNELWMPRNIEAYPNILIKIYDRYGRVVADLSGAVEGWDGTYNGKPLPTGDYWYVIRLNGAQDDREFFGHFTLYR